LGRRIRLDTVAEATLGAHKSAHGLAAVDWWKSGDIESIIKYCLQDVKITKEIYEYALKNQSIKYTDGKEVKTLKINTAPWLVKKETTLTHALPF
jgi:DEAD/DEAH box helicase domain-containing protein